MRRTTCARSGRTSTRASSTTAGTSCARTPSRARRSSAIIPKDAELTEASRRLPGVGLARRRSEEALRAPDGGLLPATPENADWNVGRLLDAVEELGDLDNTLVFYIWGDNGASMEGTTTGSFNETDVPERPRARPEPADATDRAVRRHRGPRRRPHRAALRRRLGARDEHAVPVGKAVGQPPRRHPRPDGRRLAGSASSPTRPIRTQFTHVHRRRVRPFSRPRASRARRWSTASRKSRWTARASSTRSTTPKADRAPHDAVLRDVR